MAFGFPPRSERSVQLPNLTTSELRHIALLALSELNFTVLTDEAGLLRARSPKQTLSWGHDLEIRLESAALQIRSSSRGFQVFDFGSNEGLLFDLVSTLERVARMHAGNKDEVAVAPMRTLDSIADQLEADKPPPHPAESMSFLSLFMPKEGYQVTPVVAILNIIVFAAMVFTGVSLLLPEAPDLVTWGANFRPLTLSGEWWRLITSCFVHIGAIHLLMNLYALLYIGLLLEPMLGKAKTIAAYLFTGFAASATSLLWHPATVSAGASGAIFGLYGVFLALLTTKLIDEAARRPLLSSIALFVIYNLFNGLKGNVDNAAHIGGLVSGFGIGYSFVPSLKAKTDTPKSLSPIALSMAVIVALLIFGFSRLSNDGPRYESLMERFGTSADQAVSMMRQLGSFPTDPVAVIHTQAIPRWQTASAILDTVATLELPEPILDRNKKLQRFCELQITLLRMVSTEAVTGTSTDPIQVELVQQEIRQLTSELGLNRGRSE